MDFIVGIVLGVATGWFGKLTALDKYPNFNPILLIFISIFYPLFSIMGYDEHHSLIWSLVIASIFIAVALIGFKQRNDTIIIIGLILHGIFDLTHDYFLVNEGRPYWWIGFCSMYDFGLASWISIDKYMSSR